MKRRDFLLIGGILLVALVLFLFLQLGREEGAEVIVRVNGQEQGRYSLSTEGVYELNGGTNVLRIEDGKARMEEANCPDKYCIHQGSVSRTGETITCLPNKLTVTVSGGDSFVEIVG